MTPEGHVASSQQSQRIRNNYRLTVYREASVRSNNLKRNLCLYRKPKSVRNGDEANRGSRVTRCSRPAERDETPVHLCPTTGVFGFCCNSRHKFSGSGAGAPRPRRRYGRRTHAGSTSVLQASSGRRPLTLYLLLTCSGSRMLPCCCVQTVSFFVRLLPSAALSSDRSS